MAIGWFALLYKITPGSEEEVGRLFRETGLAEPVVRNDDGEIVGQLITNLVFAGNGHACRVVEFEGELRWVGKHMGGQKVIQDFERDVDQYVEVERDMSDLPGRMAFYREAGMRHVLERSYESSGSGAESTWFSLLYKLKPGHEEAVSELFANSPRPDHEVHADDGSELGRLLTTQVFVGNGHAVRAIEVEGDIRTVAAHIGSQPAVAAFEAQVEEHLREPRDVRSPEGAKSFFATEGMQNVLLRRFEPGLAEAARAG